MTDYSALSDDALDIEIALRFDGYRWVHQSRWQEFADGYCGVSAYDAYVLRRPRAGDALVQPGETSDYLETDDVPRYSRSWDEAMRVFQYLRMSCRISWGDVAEHIRRLSDEKCADEHVIKWENPWEALAVDGSPRWLCIALLQAAQEGDDEG